MTGKINKEECISRVYQFLNNYNGNWKVDADKSGDNIVNQTEFRLFMKSSNFDFNFNGVANDAEKLDIIKAFWDSIDTEKVGTLNSGSEISDKGALNAKEIHAVANNMKATEIINQFMQSKSAPDNINSKYKTQWINSVKAGILNQAIGILKDNKKELTDVELNEILNSEKLENFYKNSSIKATADYKALEWLDSLKDEYGDIGYTVGDDKVISSIINEYINQLDNSDKSFDEIGKDIENIMNAYIDTAKTNSQESITELNKYGYDSSNLNPLQTAVLSAEFKSKAENKIKSANADLYKNYKDILDSSLKSYFENILSSVNDFNQISSSMNSYIDSYMKSEYLQIEKEYKQLVNDRAELVTAVWAQFVNKNYTSERLDVIKEVFGTNDKDEVAKTIQGYDRATLDAKKADFEAKIKEIDKKLPEDFLNGIPSEITLPQYGIKNITLPNNFGQYTTGHLHYSVVNGDGVISISDIGQVKIQGSIPQSEYKPVIYVKDDEGNIIAQKQITIKIGVYDLSQDSNLTFNGKTLGELRHSNEILLLGDGWSGMGLDQSKEQARNRIREYCNTIANSLKSNGYPEDKVNIVLDGVINYFTAYINACYDSQCSDWDRGHSGVSGSYQFNGRTLSFNTDFYQVTRADDCDAYNLMLEIVRDYGVANPDWHGGICIWEGYTGDSSYGMWISAGVIIKKFEELLNQL